MVGGAAYYAGNKHAQGQQREADQNAQIEDLQAQQAYQAQAAAPPPKADANEVMEQLQKLAQLKDQGILTDAEFEVQKSKLLQSL